MLTLNISIMKLKFLTAVFIVSGLTTHVNAQIISTSVNLHAISTRNIVNPFDLFIPTVSEQVNGKLTAIPEAYPGNIINDLSQVKVPYKGVDRTSYEGILKNNTTSGDRIIPPYKIEIRRGVSHFSIHKLCRGNEVRIKIMQNAVENNDIEDFSLAYDSGNEYRMGNIYGIENITFPLYVKVTYRSWNAFHAGKFDVTFEFIINYPGVWNVTIFN
jgi:hypothetical protein